MKKSCSATVPLTFGMSLGTLLRMVKDIPDEATVTVHISKGDRPWESDTSSIEFNWTEEIK